MLFAFQIRKVKVKGLNDAVYIAAAIYVTSMMLFVTIISTYLPVIAGHHINSHSSLFGFGLLVGATAILALVFVPKVSCIQSNPLNRPLQLCII